MNAEESTLEKSLQALVGDPSGSYVEILMEAGRIDEVLGVHLVNRSYFAHINQLRDEEIAKVEPRPGGPAIQRVIDHCTGWLDQLKGTDLTSTDASYLRDELELTLRLSLSGAQHSLGDQVTDSEVLRELYQRCWNYRSRADGLRASLYKLL